MYRVIMVPTDGEEIERSAINVAVSLAKQFNAELRLVRVETPPVVVDRHSGPGVLEQTEETWAEARRAREKKLADLGVECRALGATRVVTSLESGRVEPALKEYAERSHADLIVMSSHARGSLKRITLGSVTDYLIRNANVPVLVVKPSHSSSAEGGAATFRRVVVPLDGSALAEQILPHIASLSAEMKPSVSLLRVLTPSTYSQKQIMQPGLPWWDEEIARADADLARSADRLGADGLSVARDVVLSEDVVGAILDYCAGNEADLLALATHGVGGIKRLLFGSVADELTRRASVSLFVLHPRE